VWAVGLTDKTAVSVVTLPLSRVSMRKYSKLALLALVLGLSSASLLAGTDATVITTAAEGAFGDIATLCVAIGTFFVVYRLVKRIK